MAFNFIDNTLDKEMKIDYPFSLVAFFVMIIAASYFPMHIFKELTGLIYTRKVKLITSPEEIMQRFAFNESGSVNGALLENTLNNLVKEVANLTKMHEASPSQASGSDAAGTQEVAQELSQLQTQVEGVNQTTYALSQNLQKSLLKITS